MSKELQTVITQLKLISPEPETSGYYLKQEILKSIKPSESYSILHKVKSDEFSDSYIAVENNCRRKVELKVLKEEFLENPEVVNIFLNPALKLSKLEHPNILSLYNKGFLENNRPFYSLRYVEGHSLHKFISLIAKRELKISLTELVKKCVTLCIALEESCAVNIIHFNLTAHDVILGEFGQLTIINWNDNSCLEVFQNTITNDKKISQSDTVLCIGKILNQILTLSDSDLLNSNLEVNRIWSNQCNDSLVSVVRKSLSKKPNNRYHTVQQLKEDLERYLSGFPTNAEDLSYFQLCLKLIKRNKAQSILCLILFTIFFTTLLYFVLKIKHEEHIARIENFRALELKNKAKVAIENVKNTENQLKNKIEELKKNSSIFYDNATQSLNYLKIDDALNGINAAISLKESVKFLKFKAELLLLKLNINDLKILLKNELLNNEIFKKELNSLIEKVEVLNNTYEKKLLIYNYFKDNKRFAESLYLLKSLTNLPLYKEDLLFICKEKIKDSALGHFFIKNDWRGFKLVGDYLSVKINDIEIKSISPLSGMPISVLDISKTGVSDISALEDMPLTEISLHSCDIKDISSLKNSPLQILNIIKTPITDLSPLEDHKLISLYIDYTPIDSLDGLNFDQLKTISINGTRINNLTPLNSAIQLESLEANNTLIRDFKGINSRNIKSISASQSLLNNLDSLRNSKIKALNIKGTYINSIDSINTEKLHSLNISETEVSNIYILKNCISLRNLNLNKTKVINFSCLKDLRLDTLDVSNTAFTNLNNLPKSLKELYAPTSLNQQKTALLKLLPEIKTLYIGNSKIK